MNAVALERDTQTQISLTVSTSKRELNKKHKLMLWTVLSIVVNMSMITAALVFRAYSDDASADLRGALLVVAVIGAIGVIGSLVLFSVAWAHFAGRLSTLEAEDAVRD